MGLELIARQANRLDVTLLELWLELGDLSELISPKGSNISLHRLIAVELGQIVPRWCRRG